jgi:hypothetical protein
MHVALYQKRVIFNFKNQYLSARIAYILSVLGELRVHSDKYRLLKVMDHCIFLKMYIDSVSFFMLLLKLLVGVRSSEFGVRSDNI